MITRTEIINVLFNKFDFQSYLEIGVQVPANNFDKIIAIYKESVDPTPRGDCTYIMTSDEFFKNHVKNKYDVIFIDGLHTAEQAYKDVYNAINYLNEDGFIIMHDCNPITEYHTRSYEEFIKTGGPWNGTVFNGFIRLKNELINWSCFVVNEDHGCGIITQKQILKNKQFDYNTYNFLWKEFDINRNELLQLIDFNEYINILNNYGK
jgi:hypothetical protein